MIESFECPKCQATLDYNNQSQAVTVRCSYCGSTVIVPDSLRNDQSDRHSADLLANVVQLVANGRKIEAIKQFRQTFNVSLKEAKEVVDAIERHEDIHLGGTSFHTESVSISTDISNHTAQKNSGRSGCTVFLVALTLLIIGTMALLTVIPVSSITFLEQLRNPAESTTEDANQDAPFVIITTIEAIVPNQGPESNRDASADPAFAEVILQIGGKEGIGPGFFNDTRRLAIDGMGNIYTGDYSGGRVQVFSESGEFLATWNAGADLYMSGMTADRNGTVYIVNLTSVETYNGLTGEFLGVLDIPNGQTTYFRTATTGPDGSIYLIAKDRFIRLDSSGNIALDIADPFGNIPGFATTQEDAAVDGAGNIYVLGSETVYKLNGQGQFVDQIGSKGDAEDQFFTSPRAIAVDGQGRIFVDEFRGIKVFEGDGRYITTIESPGVSFDMVFTDENELLVMDRNSNEVRKYRLNQ